MTAPPDNFLARTRAARKVTVLDFSVPGGTGPLPLTAMTRPPTVAWFWPNHGLRQWVPVGEQYRILAGANEPGTPFLRQIDADEMIRAVQSVLAARLQPI